MPSHPPRTEPIKKQEELAKRESELVFAIKKNVETDKLVKLIEKYRQTQLSMLKAKIHHFKENEFQKKQNSIKFEKLEKMIIEWTNKTKDDIINKVKNSNNL